MNNLFFHIRKSTLNPSSEEFLNRTRRRQWLVWYVAEDHNFSYEDELDAEKEKYDKVDAAFCLQIHSRCETKYLHTHTHTHTERERGRERETKVGRKNSKIL